MISILIMLKRFLGPVQRCWYCGLQYTLTFSNQSSMLSSNKYLQIIHCRQNHWIVASSIKSYPEVTICNSLYKSVHEPMLVKIKELFGAHTTVKIAAGSSKQEGVVGCGLFAIPICVSLSNHQSVYKIS